MTSLETGSNSELKPYMTPLLSSSLVLPSTQPGARSHLTETPGARGAHLEQEQREDYRWIHVVRLSLSAPEELHSSPLQRETSAQASVGGVCSSLPHLPSAT